ncbi:probable cytochrome P450 304a1 [Diachasma alloeum]|uniref:probable cytochrome P450 304a1 n=1 Tax=Diachasma alloeum TaxID=454923 RepID=UPI0007384516|nr:probable cytochrome P450 304a1 [Diachasma alloeum]
MSPLLIIVTALLVLYACYNFVTSKPGKAPPGPVRLPLWGSYWLLLWGNYKFPHNTIRYYVKKYKSKIISLWMGNYYTVVVNDYETVKEVLTRKEFDGRDTNSFMGLTRSWGKTLGIFFNDGEEWQEQRRFALRNMRDFGFGRRHGGLESQFEEELRILVDTIKNGTINESEKGVVNGDLVYFPNILYPSCANVIWAVLTGERFDREHHDELRELCMYASMFQKGGETSVGAVAMTPWLSHFRNLFGFRDWVEGHQGMIRFIKRYIDERSEAALANKSIEGFIPEYLNGLKEGTLSGEYSEQQLVMVAVDFMFPAISAVPSVIVHAYKYMMHNPEAMKKAQAELDHVVGRERFPEWNDRKNLPYTEAALREAMRMETLTPMGVLHRCVENTTLRGYDIPVNTVMITNLAAMHNDPDFWGDPENFRPERFLDKNGQPVKDFTLPFGLGRRVCGGETFARFVMFELFATLIQQFNFSFVEGQPTSMEDKYPGLIVQPTRTWIRLTPRN